jgi:hypothetical protein
LEYTCFKQASHLASLGIYSMDAELAADLRMLARDASGDAQ